MQKLSGREKAYTYVRDQILTSPTSEGTFLNEQDLATQIGVSRTPVREALLMLEAEGLIELVPKRGALVPAMSGRQLTELMDLRGALERHAASRVLATGTAPVAEMREAAKAQDALAGSDSRDDAKAFIDLDRLFHQSLIDAARNDLLSRTYAGLRVRQMRAGLAALFASPNRQRRVCVEHEAIVAALESGDEARTHEAIDDHLEVTLQVLLRT
ncbi:GntR family transcriptional regulator [Millisia brevis]|uniref:GntR family transcriptional regulator n=1 Tax=Millisia brevis TaxID=264148 RepID=UPI000833F809|nr:GntR family transcriptional regulator [Millisia brevis]